MAIVEFTLEQRTLKTIYDFERQNSKSQLHHFLVLLSKELNVSMNKIFIALDNLSKAKGYIKNISRNNSPSGWRLTPEGQVYVEKIFDSTSSDEHVENTLIKQGMDVATDVVAKITAEMLKRQ